MSQIGDFIEPEAASRGPDLVTVAVCGGNPIVGEALAQLLRGTGYLARFLSETVDDELDALLDSSHLLLLAPGLSRGRREALLAKATNVSILELITSAEDLEEGQGSFVLWPCSVERLCQEISAILKGSA